ncbi:MAG: RNB domain-containing ribonuclease, partial [Planctomycetales bacterium]|nr:RNB domain-containing ribonuclease [Planctomycetales bacterium]
QRESLHFLRRIHSNPDPRKLKQLTEFVRLLGFDVDSLESRFEIKRVLHEVEDKPEERAVNYAVLRAMQKAIYSPEEEGHYALASDAYCHFTSPIRRYPDLTVHRLLHGLLDGKKSPGDFQQLLMLGDHCSEREQRAEVAERELVKLKLLNYLNTRIGEELDAVITGVESYGVFAQGLELPAEGLIAVHSLEDDVYDLDDAAMCLVGRRRGNSFRLGDVIRVEIGNVDVDQRQLDLRYVKHIRRHAPPKSSRARNGKPTKKKPKSGGRKKSKRRKT